MLRDERHKLILQQISLHHQVQSSDLCRLLGVSLDTIRRDLSELEQSGKIIKVHGGALSKTFHEPFQQESVYAQERKKVIASKALKLIQNGMNILTGGGTVMVELARMIPQNLKGNFFTISPLVALEVSQRSSVDVILLAGKLAPNSYVCTGSSVISQLAEIQADLCLLGINGISLSYGLSEYDWEIAQVKKALIRSSKKVAALGIAEKLDSQHKLQVCSLNSIDLLITELNPKDEKLCPYTGTLQVL